MWMGLPKMSGSLHPPLSEGITAQGWSRAAVVPACCPQQVRERDLPFVTHTLSSEFTILRVVNGETVAAENLGVTNGFVKPKLGEWRVCVAGRVSSSA